MNIKHETVRPVVCSKQAFFEFRKKNRRALAAHASSWTEIEPIPYLRRKIAKKTEKKAEAKVERAG